MSLAMIADLLERRTGLDPASLGATIMPTTVAEHMRELRCADMNAYAELLSERADLLQTLSERLAVSETWFLRGGDLFAFLAREVAKAIAHQPGGLFRVLSLPCSTGEEPYSLAIALLEAGVPAASCRIEGIDLSERAIDNARRGVFREYSFRQAPRKLRDRHFRPADGGWRIDDAVRSGVDFRVGNLLDPGVWNGGWHQFDLVFCRNLLIYFTAAARLQALEELERLVKPGGLLAVGHAESQILAGRPFRRFGPDGCFLFRHDAGQAIRTNAPATSNWVSKPALPNPAKPVVLQSRPPAGKGREENESSPAPRPTPLIPPLTAASQLADAGRLDEALAQCRTHLDNNGPSADAFCLLGVLLQARGKTEEAEDAFRKAIYLDPEHRDALTHSMLLLSQRGESSRAAALRERLKRLQPEGES